MWNCALVEMSLADVYEITNAFTLIVSWITHSKRSLAYIGDGNLCDVVSPVHSWSSVRPTRIRKIITIKLSYLKSFEFS
jgi:hypothetical protein